MTRRRNSQDDEIRELERRASEGDEFARIRLDRMKERLSTARLVFLSWDEIAKELGVEEQVVYNDGQETTTPDWIDEASWEDAKTWIEDFERSEDVVLSEDQRMAVQDNIRYGYEARWMPSDVIGTKPITEFVDTINYESRDGLHYQGISDREAELKSGLAVEIDHVIADDETSMEQQGVWFRLHEPFLTAYVNAAYGARGFGDEGLTLGDFKDGEVVFRIARWIYEAQGLGDLFKIDERRGDYAIPRTPTNEQLAEIVKKEGPLQKRCQAEKASEYLGYAWQDCDQIATTKIRVRGSEPLDVCEDCAVGFLEHAPAVKRVVPKKPRRKK